MHCWIRQASNLINENPKSGTFKKTTPSPIDSVSYAYQELWELKFESRFGKGFGVQELTFLTRVF